MKALIVVQIRNNEVTTAVLSCLSCSWEDCLPTEENCVLQRGLSRAEVSHQNFENSINVHPPTLLIKKSKITSQANFRIIVCLFKKKRKREFHTHSHMHAPICSVMHEKKKNTNAQRADVSNLWRTNTRAVTHTERAQTRRANTKRSGWASILCRIESASESQFLSAVEACISRHKRLLGLPEWLA